MAEDPNKKTDEQKEEYMRQIYEKIKKEEEERKRRQQEEERKLKEKIQEVLKEQNQQTQTDSGSGQAPQNAGGQPSQKTPEKNPTDPSYTREAGQTSDNPYQKVEVKKRKKTWVNPMQKDGIYVSIDPARSNYEFEFPETYDEETRNKFYKQIEEAKKNDKAITVPDGVNAYKVEEEKEEK